MASNNKTSYLVTSQLPEFVRSDHPTFITFLEKYYEYLEQNGKLLDISKNFNRYLDVDHANDQFREKIFEQFISLLSKNVKADRKTLVKYAKSFYRAKGTEKSVRFLIRVLFDKEIDVYYPKNDILKASDGKWFIERSLVVDNLFVNNVSNTTAATNFINHLVIGQTSNATAVVERVEQYFDRGSLITELKLTNTKRSFQNGETIYTKFVKNGEEKYLSANLLSGSIFSVDVINGGQGYTVGTQVPVESNTGSGAQLIISSTTTGSIKSIGVTYTGAGFRKGDNLFIAGGGGFGAAGNVSNVNVDQTYHPNSYNVVADVIALEANTTIGNTVYTNLSSSNANVTLANAFTYWVYSNTGPATLFNTIAGGNNYRTFPSIDIVSNTHMRSLGILGRMEIIDGGLNYVIGDEIVFENKVGSYGFGARANVTNVAANGKITQVKFKPILGYPAGGYGYNQSSLPHANVVSATGNGANVIVTSIIGDGETLFSVTDTIGSIRRITIVDKGLGYLSNPTINLTSFGDGTAQAVATIVEGVYSSPGRYINDDGILSSYNFLQDKNYYQNYSYVIRTNESIKKYRDALKTLTHPAGMRMIGEYTYRDDVEIDVNVHPIYVMTDNLRTSQYQVVYDSATYNTFITSATYRSVSYNSTYSANTSNISGTYNANSTSIIITANNHGYLSGDYVYARFMTNSNANIVNSIYTATRLTSNTIALTILNGNTANQVTGNVRLLNPVITLNVATTLATNDNVYISFSTADSTLSNALYSIKSITPIRFTILHPNIFFASANTGNANIFSKTVIVTSNNHGYSRNSNSYIRFTSGDIANAVNTIYTIGNTTTNTFNVVVTNPLLTNGDALLIDKKIYINLTNHNFANSENIQIWFTSGDTTNTVNGIYNVTVVNANTVVVNTSNFVTTNGNARIYSNNSNVIVTKNNHTFVANDLVRVEFTSGDLASIGNNVFKIMSANSNTNTFVIFHNYITINSAVNFTETSNTGNVRIGLYK